MKRVLLFLLLVGAGVAALWFAIGDEAPVVAKTGGEADDGSQRTPGGVTVSEGKMGMRVAQTGPLSFPQYRTVPLPDGSARTERVFLLDAEDSQPITDSLQQLDRVTVQLFEDDRAVAKLFAERAFLELSRDSSGRPSLQEDKEIDLRTAVFETLPGARVEGLRLELGNARVRIGEDDLRLRTRNDDDPVLLVLDGERRATLRGKGLQARLPRGKASALRRADVSILRDPVLESEGLVVRARGQLDFREDLDEGAAIVTIDDSVEVDLDHAGLAAAGDGAVPTTHIRGDRFTGWLLRRTDRDRGERDRTDAAGGGAVVWEKLHLAGAPAVVELPEGVLRTPRISVLPGPSGEPWIVTAHGGASKFEQTRVVPGSGFDELVTGASPRRIHLVRTSSGAGALLRSFGFPQWSLQSLDRTHVAVFEGDARLDGGARTITASRGLHVFHGTGTDGVAARGFGDVHIEQRATRPDEQDLVADGDDGFTLRADGSTQQLRLGPGLPDHDDADAAWRRHRYTLRHGKATATGVGVCKLDRAGDASHLWLRAPGAEIRAHLAEQGLELTDLRQLDVDSFGDEVRGLDAVGLPARARYDGPDGALSAAAPLLRQIGPRSLRLERAPHDAAAGLWDGLAAGDASAMLQRHERGVENVTDATLRGPRIDLHHVGGADVVVDATARDGEPPVVDVVVTPADGGDPTRAHCRAERIRALPFAVSREAQQLHTGAAAALAGATWTSAAAPWLVIDDVAEFRLVDPRHGTVEGRGRRLVLAQGAQAGLFVGDADAGEPAEVRRRHEGREVTTRGARVRVFRERELRLQALRTFEGRPAFLLPSVTLHEAGSTGLLSHMQATSQGDIDVLPDRVVFGGPVLARALTADGEFDPDGIAIDARELVLLRDRKTGEIARAKGRQVQVDWTRMQAAAAEVELDLGRTRCIARDPANATVTLPGGQVITAPYVEINYETMAYRARNSRLESTATRTGPR